LISQALFAQNPPFKQYTTDQGLPSNDIFGIVFDKNNNLWATSDRGVVSFDGYSYRTFSMSNGLVDNCNLRIFTGPNNEIWVTSILNSINYIVDDIVHQVPFNEDLMSVVPNEVFVQHVLFEDSIQYITFNNSGLYQSINQGPLKLVEHADNKPKNATICLIQKENIDIISFISQPKLDPNKKTSVLRDGELLYLDISTSYPDHDNRKEFVRISDHEFYLSIINKVIHIRNDSVLSEKNFANDILDLFLDRKGKLWISVQSDGVYGINNGDFENYTDHVLKGKQVTCIAQDHENRYWFSTIGEGMFLASFIQVPVYNIESGEPNDRKIIALASTEDGLFIGTFSGKLLKLDYEGNSYTISEINIPPGNGPIRKIEHTQQETFLLFRDSLLEINTDGSMGELGNFEPYSYDYLPLGSGRWWISKTRRIVEYQGYKRTRSYEESKNQAFSKVRLMFLDSHDSIWLSSQPFGTFKFKDSTTRAMSDYSDIFKSRTAGFLETPGSIWFSPSGKGLCRIKEDGRMDTISMSNSSLSSDIIDVLFRENDTTLWLGTNNGLNRLRFSDGDSLEYELRRYTIEEGLPSNRIYSIEKFQDEIWVGTNAGLIRLDQNYQEVEYSDLLPLITRIVVNDSVVPVQNEYKFKPSMDNIEIQYKAVSFSKPLGVEYMYKLEGVDRSWVKTRDRIVRYPKLRNGIYTFHLRANHAGQMGTDQSKEIKMTFEFGRHFYERPFFIVLWVILFFSLLYSLFRFVLKQLKKRELEKQRLLLAEKEALLAQMNPHFIFNSLNSIQHYIVQSDTENATTYLVRFSSLIRKILDNSRKKEISLAEEIETLNLYLNLEKLRFEEDFDFSLKSSLELDPNELKIPPMLIQPFVENAILHGLNPLKKKGLLKIDFIRQTYRLNCIIEDNGIGREKSSQLRKADYHKSTGLVNMKERIGLLNKLNNKRIFFNIEDLKDEQGRPEGTRVRLSIPISGLY